MDNLKTAKIITVATAILFAVTFSWLWSMRASDKALRQELDHQKLRSEALLSEKLLVEKSKANIEHLLYQAEDTLALLTEQISLMHRRLGDQHQNYRVLSTRFDQALRNLEKARARQKTVETTLAQEQGFVEKLKQENIRLFDSLRFYQTKRKWGGYIFF
jgi:chromosome segregation ATPase